MTPNPHRRDAVAGACPFGMGRISTHVCGGGIDNCIKLCGMDIAMGRTWL
jgi:hypothetical protein